ncbi:MAG: 50S ribosomal protein L29 [Halobacteriota archaeon]|nr:50S ribosomal protein L29 [Halobacteriota archaeon]
MSILRSDEIRKMRKDDRIAQLEELSDDLIRERGIASAGGAPENPGRVREVRRTIARIKTIQREEELE